MSLRVLLIMSCFAWPVLSPAQFQVALPPNPFPAPADSTLWHIFERNFLENAVDTTITLRLGQYFLFTESQPMMAMFFVTFDSVQYNGGGNNRRAYVSLRNRIISYNWDTTRQFLLPYLSRDSSHYIDTIVDTFGFQLRVGLEKIINVGPLSIAKLNVLRHGLMLEPTPAMMAYRRYTLEKEVGFLRQRLMMQQMIQRLKP